MPTNSPGFAASARPACLREGVGASYHEYSNLVAELSVSSARDDFMLPADARATGWADGLLLEGAEPLAYYQHPHFGRFPAIVSQVYGQGRITYCGTLPNPALAKALAQWVLQQAQISPLFADLPRCVRGSSATTASGEKLSFFTNWSWEPQQIALALNGRDLMSGRQIKLGDSIELGAWDTQIVVVSSS